MALPRALAAGQALEEYRIDAVLGMSAFGITYQAYDTLLDMTVAIKEYFPAQWVVRHPQHPAVVIRSKPDRTLFIWGMACFLREARVLLKLKHPNIVQVLRFFEANRTAYMVMDYEQGHSFETVVAARGLDEQQLIALLMSVLDGLEAIRQRGILHHNIKPDNLYIRPDGSPVLLDFSSGREVLYCRQRAAIAAGQPLSDTNPVGGQYADYIHQESWVDGYALAEVAYYAVSGILPSSAATRIAALEAAEPDPLVSLLTVAKKPYSLALLQAIEQGLRLPVDRQLTLEQWRQGLLRTVRHSPTAIQQRIFLLGLLVSLLLHLAWLATTPDPLPLPTVQVLPPMLPLPSQVIPALPEERPAGEIWVEPMTQMSFVWLPSGQLTRRDKTGQSSQAIAGFWLGQYEVTNEQYQLYQPTHDSGRYQGHHLTGPQQPVVQVNWEEVTDYAAWLSDDNDIFQLPTEAQWEYACRAGNQAKYSWGDAPDTLYLNYADKNIRLRWADSGQDDGYAVTAPVGKFCPNAWKLYDMSGNVWEWMADWQDFNPGGSAVAKNNLMINQASLGRDIRGGSWGSVSAYTECAHHVNIAPDMSDVNLGFRLVRIPMKL